MQPVVNFTRVALVVVLASTFACRANNNDKDVDTSEANSPPQPASGIAVVTDEDASSVINLSATDADNDPLEFGIAVRPEHGTLSPEVPGRQSQVTYTPDPDFNGEDSFSFTVSDGVDTSSPEQVAITVAPVNDPPNTGAPILAETQEGRPVVVRLTATDIDDVDLTFRDRRQPLNGTLDTSALPDVTYTPNENFAGEDTFTYLASDGLLDSPEGTVIITVLDLNDAPVGTDDFYETDEDRALVVGAPGVLGNDTDIDFDSLTARKLTDPSHGTVELNTDGSFTFTPGPNETSDVSFTYVASDGVEDSEPITVTVELDSINDRPIGVVDEYELSEDDVGYVSAFSVLVNDELAEIDGDPLLAILGTTTSNGALALFEDGTFTYTPNPNFNGVDTFTYQATDGPSVSDRTTVTLRVLPENDAPVAVRDNYSTAEDTVLVRGFGDGLLANDSDVDLDELSVVVVDLPSFGGVVVDPDDGSFTYTPEPDFNGVDTFTYQAEDPSGARSAVTAVNITVDPRNDPPTADDDSFDGFEDVPLVVLPPGVIDGDSDLDGDVITALQVAPPVNGVLDLDGDGSFTYTPFLNFNGVDSFTYQVTDGRLQSSVATVTLNIADTNDAPEPLDDVAEVDEDAVLVVGAPGILGNDTDRDLNEIIVHDVVDEPEHGSLSWAADGSYRYEPDDDYNGPDGFTYLVRDEEGAISEDVATVSITVVPTNDVPVVVDDEYETDEDLPLAVATRDGVRDNLLTGDFDIDGDPLVVELVASASLGALTLRADGSFNYSAAPNVNGVDGFTYRVFDGSAYSAVASVTIVVNPVNDRPVAVADVYATREDVALVPDPLRNLLANDSDIDGDALAPRLTVPAGNGVAVIEPDGRFTYTPSPGFNGLDTFTYVVNDGRIDSLPAVVSVNVGIENDAPIAVDDALDAIEDTDLVVGPPGVLGNDSDPDDPGAVPGVDITAQLNVPPAHGLLVGGLLADGSFTYRPDPDFNGPDSFTYFAFDGVEFSGVATVAINVAQRNDGPVADADAYSVAEDTRLDVTDPAEGVLAGDTDIDLADPDVPGDRDDVLELIAVLVDSPLHDAAFDLNDDGTFTYLPDPDYNGVDTFTYRAQDPSGTVSAPATVTITVTPQNDAPVAGPDGPYVVDEDTSLVVDAPGLLVNDSDVDMDGLAVDLETPASNGSVLLSGDGSFVYTPNRNFNGVDFFEYVATDGRALSTPTLVTINVLPVNDRPVALSDAYVTDEDVALLIDPPGVLSNDSDIDFDALSSFVVLPPVSGALSLDSDGGLLYTPDLDFVGDDFFTYVASDGVLDSDPATVFITVEPANDAPIGVDDGPYIFDEDTTFVAGLVNGVLRNDSDVDEDPLTAIGVGAPTNALEFELRADGTFTYTPNVDFVGIDTFTYRATDGLLNSAITTVTLDVQPINDAPVGVADLYFASEDTTLERDALAGVLANDTDADDPSHGVDDPLTAEVRRPPSNGDLDMNPDGSFTYTPDEDFIGDDTFTYQAFDGFLRSAYTTVTINVGDSNDAPDVEDDAYGVIEDTLLVVDAPGVLDNDSDPEGDLMSARVTVSPIHGALVLAADGGFEFMPEADYVGPDSFVYVVDDSRGATSAPATVTLTVGGENDAPRTLDDDYVVAEDVPLVVDAPGVLGNDTDLEGDAMSALLGVRPANGTVLLVGDGSFTYTGDANYNGPDSFTYQAFDGIERSAPTTVNITVTAVNDVAVTVDDNYVTGEDTPLSIDALSGVLSNDNDVESDPLSLTAVKVTDPANGSVALGADGAFVYTPNLDFIGVDSFRYQIDDFGDLSAEATVTITVENDDDAPVVADDAYDIDEDAVLSVPSVSGVLANDFDIDGEPLTADLVATTTEGVLSLNANGSFTYTPGPNFNGEDSFTYTANDGALDSAVATARITVNPVNDAPTAAPDAYAATEEEEIDISSVLGVLANDTDIDGDVLTATLVATTPNGSLALDLDGSFTYTSDIDFSGVDTFTYRVNDPTGPGDTAVVTITVGDGNDAPVGTDDAFDAVEDTVLDVPPLFGVLANDSDADGDPMTVSLLASTSAGALVLDADGSFVYTPAADATGVDSFTYQIADGRGGLGTATATITVAPVNDAPRPVADAFTVDEDVLFVSSPVSVLDNDVEVDGDPLIEAVVVANPLHGDLVLAGDGTWEYDPDPNYHGPDSFQYRARDGFVPDSVPSTVTITVAPVNDAPTGVADIYDTREDEPLVVDSIRGVLANDSDVDGDALTAVILSPPPLGSVSLALDGSFTYTPAADFAGPESFTYQADDGALLSSAITVTINVGAEDDAPIVVDDAYVVTEDTVLNVDRFAGMLSNDFDLEGESLTVVGIDALPVLGTLTFNANGSFVYTPFVDEDGDGDGTTVDDTFTYRVSDGTFEVVGLVEITIDPVNDAPRGLPDAFVTDEDTPIIAGPPGLLGNDTDVEGDAFVATLISEPSHGALVLDPDGTFVYTPAPDYNGEDFFRYAPEDDDLGATLTVNLTINPVNDVPVPTADTYVVNEDTLLGGNVMDNDLDVDSLVLTVALVDDVSNGTLSLASDGTFTYTPDPDWFSSPAPDQFTYNLSDGLAVVGPTTVDITVTAQGDVPRGVVDAYGTLEDTPLVVGVPGVLGNDVEVDGAFPFEGEAITAELVVGPPNGDVSLNSDGSFTYTPDLNYNLDAGPETFTYRPVDGDGPGATVTVTLSVDPVNDIPVSADDLYVPTEDVLFTADVLTGVLANDTDVEGDALTAVLVDTTVSGLLALSSDGSFTYQPDPDFDGVDSFTYRATDSEAGTLGTVTLTVGAVNDRPTCVGDGPFVTSEDNPLDTVSSVLANDDDIDADPLTATLVGSVANGALTLRPDGTFLYTPNAHYNGPDSFTYRPSDGIITSVDLCSVSINVTPVNDAPVAAVEAYVMDEDEVLSIGALAGVLANDSDIDSGLLTASVVAPPASGVLNLISDGSFTYTPAPNVNGLITFTYQVSDGALTDTAVVSINISAVNDAPVALADAYDATEDAPLVVGALEGLIANDSDVDLDLLTTTVDTPPTKGALALASNGSFTYTPNANANGIDSFVYSLSDGALTDTATVTIDITAENDAPVAVDDSYAIDEDGVLSVLAAAGVRANDTDVETLTSDLTIAVLDSTDDGALSLAANGSFTYTPDANFNGVDSFTYTVSDGVLTGTGTATITVNPINDAPVGVDDAYPMDEDTVLTVAALAGVLINDTDVDVGASLTAATVTDEPDDGIVDLNSDGSFDYTPNPDFFGVDTFTYRVTDGVLNDTATVTITVSNVQDAPVAVDDVAAVTEDGVLAVSPPGVLANDSDVDGDALTSTILVGPIHGTLTFAAGGASVNGDGSYRYTPDPDYFGPDSFTYEADDGIDTTAATVNITVNPLGDVPVASDDAYVMAEDGFLSPLGFENLLANDSDDDGEPLTVNTSPIVAPTNGVLVLDSDGGFDYTPNPDFNGVDSFVYEISDPGGDTAQATATITVNPVNDAPVAVADSYDVDEDLVLSVGPVAGVRSNDTDVDGDALSITSLVLPTNGTLSLNVDGSFVYDSAPNYNGPDSFTYTVSDGVLTDTAVVTLTVNPVNDAPTADDDVHVVAEDGVLVVGAPGLLSNDTDIDLDALTVDTSPIVNVVNGALSLASDGSFTYTPDPNYNGVDTFTYEIDDGAGGTSQASVTITVTPVNDAPVAVDDGGYAVDEDSSLSVDIVSGVRTNDTDVDGDGLSVSVTSPPSDGVLVLSADGSFDYTPDPDFSGVDSFVYQVSDGALTDTAVATITVNAINDPPQADPDSGYAVDEDAVLVVGAPSGVLTNDSDIDGDAITLNTTPVVLPTHGDVVLSLDGSFVYFPDPDYNGGDSFTYEISDGALTDTATVSITVDPTNDAPVALDDTGFVVAEDGSLVVGDLGGVLANDTDIDGDGLLVNTSPVVNVANGVLSLASDGSFTYTPTADYNGPDSFTYEISDGALTDTATVTITVNAVDDAPIANADAYVTDEDVDLSVGAPGLLDNDVDIDADGLTVNTTPVVDPTDGAVTLAADGSFLYEPDPGFAGVDTFTYEITDGIGTDTAVVTITITGAPTPPLAVDDAYTWVGGATYVQAALGGVLDNDLETEADPFTLTPIVGGATALGGTVDLGADGSFTYVPPAGVGSTVDSFDYTITDDDGSDVGSVDITLGTLVWFVDNAVAPGGDGTEDAPFDTLLAAETASGAGDVLYVMAGDGTPAGYDAGVVLSDDQRLIGEGVDLVVDAIALASAGGRPVLTNVGGVVVEIPDGASGDFEIAGLDLAEATFGIDVGTGLAPADAVSVHDVGIQLTTTGIASASGTLDVVDVDIVAGGGVVINEVHPDPDGVLGDANCDAVVSPTHDEFVEIVNHTEHPVNLTGATLSDASAVRHTFAPGTILDPGDAIVVFGGGTPSCSLPPNATHIVGDGSLSLANAGDSVTLTSAMGTVLDTMTYDGAEGSSDQSLVRSPELFGPFVRHATDAGHADLFSVGEAGDGSAFVAPSFPLVDGISASASSVSVVTSRVDGASGSGVTTSEVGTLVVDDTLLRVCGTGITVDYVSAVGPSVTLSDNVLVGNGVDALGMVDGITITGSPDSGVFAISGNDISGFASGGVVHLGDTVETIASVLTVSANTVHDFDGDAFLVLGDSGGTNAEYTFTLNAVDGGSAALGGLTPGAGVLVDAGALDDILVSITDNDFDDLAVAADFTLVTTSTVTSLIDGNAVGAASAVGAGGDAFAFGSAGSSTLNVTVDGNTISAGSGDITYATIGGACTVATAIAGNEAPGFVLDATSAGTFSLEGALPADTVTANLDDLLNTTSGGAPSVADSGTITIVGVGTIPTP